MLLLLSNHITQENNKASYLLKFSTISNKHLGFQWERKVNQDRKHLFLFRHLSSLFKMLEIFKMIKIVNLHQETVVNLQNLRPPLQRSNRIQRWNMANITTIMVIIGRRRKIKNKQRLHIINLIALGMEVGQLCSLQRLNMVARVEYILYIILYRCSEKYIL